MGHQETIGPDSAPAGDHDAGPIADSQLPRVFSLHFCNTGLERGVVSFASEVLNVLLFPTLPTFALSRL